MSNIAVVTDSTAYLTEEEIEELGVYVLPLSVTFDSESFLEGEDISIEDFFLRVREAKDLPKSSQPSIGRFYEMYKNLSEQYDAIISIHISSGISGTFQTANIISKQNEDFNIYPFDSTVTIEIQAELVREAVNMSQEGYTPTEIINRLQFMVENSGIYFAVDNLTNLIKGGRVPKSLGNVANLLNVKPILTFKNGEIISYNNVRTRKRAVNEIKKIFTKATDESKYPLKASIVHVFDEVAGEELLKDFKEVFPEIEFRFGYIGPVIGTHVGEKAFGLTWTVDFKKMN